MFNSVIIDGNRYGWSETLSGNKKLFYFVLFEMLLQALIRITGQNCRIPNAVAYEGDVVMCEPN